MEPRCSLSDGVFVFEVGMRRVVVFEEVSGESRPVQRKIRDGIAARSR